MIRKWAAAGLAVAAVSNCATAPEPIDTSRYIIHIPQAQKPAPGELSRPAGRDYYKCIEETAARFSQGPDRADIVARGAVSACSSESYAFTRALAAEGETFAVKVDQELGLPYALEVVIRQRASDVRK